MGQLKFSIVTVVLNSRSYIRQAIENVLGQGYDNFEHIVTSTVARPTARSMFSAANTLT